LSKQSLNHVSASQCSQDRKRHLELLAIAA